MKKNTFIGMIAAIAMTLVSSAAMAWGPGHGRGSYVGSWYGIMPVLGVLVLIATVCFALCLSRRCVRKKKEEVLLESLKARYAKGEITKEEYDRNIHDLRNESYLDNQIQFEILNQRYARGEITREDFGCKAKDLKEESILAILIPRYARGEITKEEFERIKKDSEELYNAC